MSGPRPSDRGITARRIRSLRRRLRTSYRRSLEKSTDEAEARAAAELARKVAANMERASQLVREAQEKLALVSREVVDLRLRYQPGPRSSRFTLYATMDEQFVRYASDLKLASQYIIEVLAARIRSEFGQIDFSRMKPVDFVGDTARRREPVFEFTPFGDGEPKP